MRVEIYGSRGLLQLIFYRNYYVNFEGMMTTLPF